MTVRSAENILNEITSAPLGPWNCHFSPSEKLWRTDQATNKTNGHGGHKVTFPKSKVE